MNSCAGASLEKKKKQQKKQLCLENHEALQSEHNNCLFENPTWALHELISTVEGFVLGCRWNPPKQKNTYFCMCFKSIHFHTGTTLFAWGTALLWKDFACHNVPKPPILTRAFSVPVCTPALHKASQLLFLGGFVEKKWHRQQRRCHTSCDGGECGCDCLINMLHLVSWGSRAHTVRCARWESENAAENPSVEMILMCSTFCVCVCVCQFQLEITR